MSPTPSSSHEISNMYSLYLRCSLSFEGPSHRGRLSSQARSFGRARSHFGSSYGIACRSNTSHSIRSSTLSPVALAVAAMAAPLLLEVHGQLLRTLSAHAGVHFSGLAVASRKVEGMTSGVRKK